jgi:hypothetical protein
MKRRMRWMTEDLSGPQIVSVAYPALGKEKEEFSQLLYSYERRMDIYEYLNIFC